MSHNTLTIPAGIDKGEVAKMSKSCFVVMSLDHVFDGVYHEAIRPAAENRGYQCQRVDDKQDNVTIPDEIVKSLNEADLIVADATEPNPNVHHETGVFDTIGDKIITITSKIETLPCDIKLVRPICYKNSHAGRLFLRSRLVEAINELEDKGFNLSVKSHEKSKNEHLAQGELIARILEQMSEGRERNNPAS